MRTHVWIYSGQNILYTVLARYANIHMLCEIKDESIIYQNNASHTLNKEIVEPQRDNTLITGMLLGLAICEQHTKGREYKYT